MKCPACASTESAVIRTTCTEKGVQRTRQCAACGKRWVTIEAPREHFEAAEAVVERFRALEEACGPLAGRE